ncbi:MAG TPA: DNA polymerase III subunit beta [Clostridia bacterium]|nr:DNA polymerase III subunit beta [Clostridia bacterium]
MKIAFNASDFNHGMSMVSHALPARVIKPYQEGVFIETLDTGVRLTVTDGEVAIQSIIPAEVREDGSALLPARLLGELVRNLEGNVELDTESNEAAVVRNKGSKTRLVLFAADDFPDIQQVVPESVTSIAQSQFKNAVRGIIFAIATDETRRILTGCLMETSADEVRFTCLDGYRLAMQRVYCRHEMPEGKDLLSYILPGALVGNISRMLPDADQPITLTLSRTHMMAEFGETKVFSPLILGEYINYRQILPTSWTTALRVNRAAISAAIQRASLIAREGSNNLLKLRIEDQALTISAMAEKGAANEQIPIDFDGNPLNIAFNATYLNDVIKNIDTEDLSMRFNTNVSPCVVCPVSGNQYTYLVLPVRMSD